MKFLEILCENKWLSEISDVADKFSKFYNVMNLEEKIIIISAYDLTEGEKAEVLAALKES